MGEQFTTKKPAVWGGDMQYRADSKEIEQIVIEIQTHGDTNWVVYGSKLKFDFYGANRKNVKTGPTMD